MLKYMDMEWQRLEKTEWPYAQAFYLGAEVTGFYVLLDRGTQAWPPKYP